MAILLLSLYNIDLGPNRLASSDLCIFTFVRVWSISKEKKKLLLVRVIWCSKKAECLIQVVDHLKLHIKSYSYQNINTASSNIDFYSQREIYFSFFSNHSSNTAILKDCIKFCNIIFLSPFITLQYIFSCG